MQPDFSLREKVIHGTKKNPLTALHFTTGNGTIYPEHFLVERHWHPYMEIIFIRKGSYLFEINLENHILAEGDICILNSGDLHQITGQQQETIHDVIIFDPQILDFSYVDEPEELFIAPLLNHTIVAKNIIRSTDDCYQPFHQKILSLFALALPKERDWYIRCKLLLLDILNELYQNHLLFRAETIRPASDIRKINRYKIIISYIREHYAEPVTLQQLADTIPCNSQYLCRFFKEIAGVSPIQYLISYRLERAEELLLHSQSPIMDIAMDCGFDNISYFIRKFKEVKQCTPNEFRKQSCCQSLKEDESTSILRKGD